MSGRIVTTHVWLGLASLAIAAAVAGCERSRQPDPTALKAEKPLQKVVLSSLSLRVTAENFKWHLKYPGPDGILDTPDDILTQQHLHLPTYTNVSIELLSNDWVYSFFLPHLGLTDIAVPDAPFTIEFQTGASGNHRLLGSQMCGYTHPDLLGDVVIHTQQEFGEWLQPLIDTNSRK